MAEPLAPRETEWLHRPERGTALGLKMLIFTMRLLGRGGVRIVLAVVGFYYALFAGAATRASREYLARLYPKVTFWMVVRHIRTFGEASFDRMLFAAGRTDEFEIERTGKENLAELARKKQGAILLGAHVGSFEAMRAMARHEDIKINVLVHFENARKINAMLKAIAPEFQARIIEIDPASPHFVLTVAERIEAGELVAILGDRIGIGERTAVANFMGSPALFPVGPYTLAAVLKCPIYLTFGLYHRPRMYSLYCEPFAERVELPRKSREAALQELVQRYADRLELFVRRAPYCWFNFFDFWASARDDVSRKS
jgi:predicted LPLAT superfamily acyltransferase